MSQESLENSLRELKNTKAIYYEKIADFQKNLAITASIPQKFELNKLINECEKKIRK